MESKDPKSNLSLSILVPAYNEEKSIEKTITELLSFKSFFKDFEIIVINDGSSDRTGEVVRDLPVTCIDHELNRGYGAALKSGLVAAKHEFILITDADGTYPLDQIPALAEEAAQYDMVVGARTGKVVQVPLLRRPAKWLITKLANYLSGRRIPDLNSGMRIFRKDIALKYLTLYPDGFSFTTTITLAMLTNHFRVKFVPINYFKRVGKSSIHPIRDFINFTILIIRICAFFKPLNVFVPPALIVIFLGLLKGSRDFIVEGNVGLLAGILILAGIQMIFIALLADLMDQRMKL